MFSLVARRSGSLLSPATRAGIMSSDGAGPAQFRGREIQRLNSVGHPLTAVYLQRREFCPPAMLGGAALVVAGLTTENGVVIGFGALLMMLGSGEC